MRGIPLQYAAAAEGKRLSKEKLRRRLCQRLMTLMSTIFNTVPNNLISEYLTEAVALVLFLWKRGMVLPMAGKWLSLTPLFLYKFEYLIDSLLIIL